MEKRFVVALVCLLGCGGGSPGDADAGVDASEVDAATDAGHDGGVCALASTCPVTWSACQARTCDETLGCGPVTPIREGFGCDDANANTYDDLCAAGTCAGTPLACSVDNGGCVTATCVGYDPAPPSCVCSGRYTVTGTQATDMTTGLTWEQVASAATFTQAGAVTRCSGLGSGWRVPTKEELAAIVVGIVGPRIDACAFPTTASALFWSSTAIAGMPGKFWGSDFASGGNLGGESGDDGSAAHFVRCVH